MLLKLIKIWPKSHNIYNQWIFFNLDSIRDNVLSGETAKNKKIKKKSLFAKIDYPISGLYNLEDNLV